MTAQKNPVCRPLEFESVEVPDKAIAAYFKECDREEDRGGFSGEILFLQPDGRRRGPMNPVEQVEKRISLRGEECKVTAGKSGATWKASGKFRGVHLTIHRAATSDQTFEWWKNKAGKLHTA
jgi:hypothetical protein